MKSQPFVTLYKTDTTTTIENNLALQYDCIYVPTIIDSDKKKYQVISYCMDEYRPQWKIQNSNRDQILTFADLAKQQITSQQLYMWSAPMDIVERYQSYLYEDSNSMDASTGSQIFYNCTSPWFGPVCEYSFDNDDHELHSFSGIIHELSPYVYKPTTLTCYMHMQCNRGSASTCLDWTEICDAKIDCINDGHDEENCWQLEVNECQHDEFRCLNGQCIPYAFYRDEPFTPDCLDGSDEVWTLRDFRSDCNQNEPTFTCEDVACTLNHQYYRSGMTSSCLPERSSLLVASLFLKKPNSVLDLCWETFLCVLHIENIWNTPTCTQECSDGSCNRNIITYCPDMLFLPPVPVLFSEVYFAYKKTESSFSRLSGQRPQYICFKGSLCREYLSKHLPFIFNGTTCYNPEAIGVIFPVGRGSWEILYIKPLFRLLHTCYSIVNSSSVLCSRPLMYQCMNSTKCIPRHRLNDGVIDCFYRDDEQFEVSDIVSWPELFKEHFYCVSSNESISNRLVGDGFCHCKEYDYRMCDDEFPADHFIRNHVSFQTICDAFVELLPITVNEQIETDETNCEHWPCDNIYTRCDGFWNCPNGADEVNCTTSSLIDCPPNHHECVSLDATQLMCLSLEKANDGIVDCIGGIDEPDKCRRNYDYFIDANFYCNNDEYEKCVHIQAICDRGSDCTYGADEQVCDQSRNLTYIGSICKDDYVEFQTIIENSLCRRSPYSDKRKIIHFTLENRPRSYNTTVGLTSTLPPTFLTRPSNRIFCHRGFGVRVWLNKDRSVTKTACLCPPSYYGDFCQYQNQRVSVTMQLRALSDAWRIPFVIVVMLIDDGNERTIHSYNQFTYLPMRDCETKLHTYLLYATRPKNSSGNHSVHIEIYEKLTLVYRGSWLLPLKFPFLPVHRIAVQLDIPRSPDSAERCTDAQCIHGYCSKYTNHSNGSTFCRCMKGWSGRYCTIPYSCTCSSDSRCIGISVHNRSLCVCPINRWGTRCFLNSTSCKSDDNSTCLNGGHCIAMDEHTISEKAFTCICAKGFTGHRCEIPDTKVIVSLHKDIPISQAMLVHFIHVMENTFPERSTTFKTIHMHNTPVSVYWSRPFHLMFVELFNKSYYLAVIQTKYSPSTTITKTIEPSDRCESISELFNETIVNLHLVQRIKYYHIPCREHMSVLSCFYDDVHLCICTVHGSDRIANCFEFDHHMKSDCRGQSGCENGAQCFQDTPTCAQTSICVCPTCFYGVRCQFTTTGFVLSLDAILGYQIIPHVNIRHQPWTVKITGISTLIMVLTGLANGFLSLIPFRSNKLREAGCSLYLIGSSVSTILTMLLFGIKFWILVGTQIATTVNRSFLLVQCIMLDFLLRICVALNQWMNACIAAERVTTALTKANFNKKLSKQVAKYVIALLLIVIVCTAIHDPLHRQLFDENNDEEKRVWCIASYPPTAQKFNSTIHLFHFFVPFFINIISALVIFRTNIKQRAVVQPQLSYRQLLREQIHQHNHLILAPIIIIILSFPRVILSFVSGCMKSTHDSWVFLIGYYVSFAPPMCTFIIFILPSKLYRKEVRKSFTHYRHRIQTWFVSCYNCW